MRNLARHWRLLSVALLALSGAGAYGAYLLAPGVELAAASPGAGAFIPTIAISAAFGDVIVNIEEGRDHRSPFASITALISSTNPTYPILVANPPPVPPPGLLYPAAPPGFVLVQFVYRSTNDPVNPGWAAAPGAGGLQVEASMASAHAVAEALSAYRAFAAPPGTASWVEIEFDNNPGLTFMEFYKFRVVR
jgi:hypothetical protein